MPNAKAIGTPITISAITPTPKKISRLALPRLSMKGVVSSSAAIAAPAAATSAMNRPGGELRHMRASRKNIISATLVAVATGATEPGMPRFGERSGWLSPMSSSVGMKSLARKASNTRVDTVSKRARTAGAILDSTKDSRMCQPRLSALATPSMPNHRKISVASSRRTSRTAERT